METNGALSAEALRAAEAWVFGDQCTGAWQVLLTRSRQEKMLSRDLVAMDIAHFLPLVWQVRFYGGRKVRTEVPLFPGYVFLRGDMESVYRADRTRRVARILQVNDQDRIHWELRNLHIALTKGVPLDPYPFLREGVRVEVRSGPFRGLQGVVESRQKMDRIVLQVEILGSAVSLEIDAALLELLD